MTHEEKLQRIAYLEKLKRIHELEIMKEAQARKDLESRHKERGIAEGLGRQVGRTLRAVGVGLAGAADLPALVVHGASKATGGKGIERFPSEKARDKIDEISSGYLKPESRSEELSDAVVEAVSGPAIVKGAKALGNIRLFKPYAEKAGKLGKYVSDLMGEKASRMARGAKDILVGRGTGTEIGAAAGSGLASKLTADVQESEHDPSVARSIGAGLVGGVLGGGITHGITRARAPHIRKAAWVRRDVPHSQDVGSAAKKHKQNMQEEYLRLRKPADGVRDILVAERHPVDLTEVLGGLKGQEDVLTDSAARKLFRKQTPQGEILSLLEAHPSRAYGDIRQVKKMAREMGESLDRGSEGKRAAQQIHGDLKKALDSAVGKRGGPEAEKALKDADLFYARFANKDRGTKDIAETLIAVEEPVARGKLAASLEKHGDRRAMRVYLDGAEDKKKAAQDLIRMMGEKKASGDPLAGMLYGKKKSLLTGGGSDKAIKKTLSDMKKNDKESYTLLVQNLGPDIHKVMEALSKGFFRNAAEWGLKGGAFQAGLRWKEEGHRPHEFRKDRNRERALREIEQRTRRPS